MLETTTIGSCSFKSFPSPGKGIFRPKEYCKKTHQSRYINPNCECLTVKLMVSDENVGGQVSVKLDLKLTCCFHEPLFFFSSPRSGSQTFSGASTCTCSYQRVWSSGGAGLKPPMPLTGSSS